MQSQHDDALEQLTHSLSQDRNIYNREKLYKEVWEQPVIKVAVKYGVSDVAIHKVCKSLNIPVPPRGYWAKVRAGQKPEKIPLPATSGMIGKTGTRTRKGVIETNMQGEALVFLSESERQRVFQAAQIIQVSDENTRLHKKILAYKSVVKEWNKNNSKHEGAQKDYKSYSKQSPFLAGVISNETLGRVYRILDTLYRQVENLGGHVNDDLSLRIRNEQVSLKIIESQDRIKHEMTRQEAKEMLLYEDAKRHHGWSSKPQIRKYDYVFNGRIRISIGQKSYFKDTQKANIESRLGDVLIGLYKESEVVRIVREAREEAERKRREEARLREERRKQYSSEVKKTNELVNTARDYETACKIRDFVAAVKATGNLDDKTAKWVEWASRKADWYDPTVARKDEILGQREHSKSEEEKAIRTVEYNWWK